MQYASPKVRLVRKDMFCAAHRLYNHDKDVAWNEHLYGKCARDNGHGHNYVLEVTVEGVVDPETGMVINLLDLQTLIKERILDHVDHFHLNHDVPFLNGVNPTAENLSRAFWRRLEEGLKGAKLVRLRLWETPENMVELDL